MRDPIVAVPAEAEADHRIECRWKRRPIPCRPSPHATPGLRTRSPRPPAIPGLCRSLELVVLPASAAPCYWCLLLRPRPPVISGLRRSLEPVVLPCLGCSLLLPAAAAPAPAILGLRRSLEPVVLPRLGCSLRLPAATARPRSTPPLDPVIPAISGAPRSQQSPLMRPPLIPAITTAAADSTDPNNHHCWSAAASIDPSNHPAITTGVAASTACPCHHPRGRWSRSRSVVDRRGCKVPRRSSLHSWTT
jgi:hypothetical protein